MNYTILIYETAADFAARTDPKKQEAYWASWPPYKKALTEAGVFVGGAGVGWALLNEIPADAVRSYQPYWAATAHILKRLGRSDEAAADSRRAIGLCEDAAMREFLTRSFS